MMKKHLALALALLSGCAYHGPSGSYSFDPVPALAIAGVAGVAAAALSAPRHYDYHVDHSVTYYPEHTHRPPFPGYYYEPGFRYPFYSSGGW